MRVNENKQNALCEVFCYCSKLLFAYNNSNFDGQLERTNWSFVLEWDVLLF